MYEIIVLLEFEIFNKQLKEYKSKLTVSVIMALEFFIDSDAIFALENDVKCRDPPFINSKILS